MRNRQKDAETGLYSEGNVATLIREKDWSTTSLASPAQWPDALRIVVNLILDASLPMFVLWGERLTLIYNDTYTDFLEDRHPAALGTAFNEVWDEAWSDLKPSILQAMAGEPVHHENFPVTIRRKDVEQQAWFTFSYSPIRGPAGEVQGLFGTVLETTANVLADRHRNLELARMQLLFQQAPGIIASLRGREHIFELANAAYMRLVGPREILGKSVREALPEVEGQGFFELLDKVYESGEAYIGFEVPVRLQKPEDDELEVRYLNFVYQPICDHLGNVSGIFIEGSDVTDAVLATKALRESEQRLRQLANTIPQIAWMTTADGYVDWYNDRWYDFTGTTLEQMLGSDWSTFFHPDDGPRVVAQWNTALRTGKGYEVRARMKSKDGEYRSFYIRAEPLLDSTGKISRWFGTNTDVTLIEHAQNELETANRRKDEFLAMLAHELRNPLAPIATAAEILRLGPDEQRVRHAGDVIARQARHMKELLDDLLDVSRVTRGLITLKDESLNLNSIVAEAIEQVNELISAKQHNLRVETAQAPLFVRGDKTRLVQVFANLLNNAAKYTPEKGNIFVQLKGENGVAAVSVSDDGIGLSPELLPYVFELFSQGERSGDRLNGGLGLGLALVKRLLTLHGGSVTASSPGKGNGSTFVVQLPAVLAATPEASSDSKLPVPLVGKKLAVVDDNLDVAESLSLLLQAIGHTVHVFPNAGALLDSPLLEDVDAALIDIGLPGVDGYELAKRLRASPLTQDVTLIAVSGYGQPEYKIRAKAVGFDNYLVKPVSLEILSDAIAQLGYDTANE